MLVDAVLDSDDRLKKEAAAANASSRPAVDATIKERIKPVAAKKREPLEQTITSVKKSCLRFIEGQKQRGCCPVCGKVVGSAGSMTAWMFQELRCNCERSAAMRVNASAATGADQNRLANAAPSATGQQGYDSVRDYSGSVIDKKYRVEQPLGKGRNATVYRATHLPTDRSVAIKIVFADQTDKAMQRLRREARAILDIRHPNIVAVYDFDFIDESKAYLIMELLEGQTLLDFIEKEGRLSQKLSEDFLRQLLNALHEVHKQGVINRDIKSNNIMLVKGEGGISAKIVDFGLAKMDFLDMDVPITRSGELLGTPLYMSPEQCMGRAVDARSDIYSLGCVAYEMLTGVPPFVAESFFSVMRAHVRKKPRRPRDVQPACDASPAFEDLVLSMLEKEASKRPQSALEALSMLDRLDNVQEPARSGWSPDIVASLRTWLKRH